MMKKILITLFAAIYVASCTIIYDTQFNEDNGGQMSMIVDMEEFVQNMGKAGEMLEKTQKRIDNLNKRKHSPDSMTVAEYIEQAAGISNAVFFQTDSNYTFGLQFDFKTPKALNNAMNRMEHFNERKRDSTAVLKDFVYYKFYSNKLVISKPFVEAAGDDTESKMSNTFSEAISLQWKLAFKKKKIKEVKSDYEFEISGKNMVQIQIDGKVLKERDEEKIATIFFK